MRKIRKSLNVIITLFRLFTKITITDSRIRTETLERDPLIHNQLIYDKVALQGNKEKMVFLVNGVG